MPNPQQRDTIERWHQLRRESRVAEAVELLRGLFEDLAEREGGKVVVTSELYESVGDDFHSYANIWNELKIILKDDLGRTIIDWRRCYNENPGRWRELATAFVRDSVNVP